MLVLIFQFLLYFSCIYDYVYCTFYVLFQFAAVKVPYPEDTKLAAISQEEKEYVCNYGDYKYQH